MSCFDKKNQDCVLAITREEIVVWDWPSYSLIHKLEGQYKEGCFLESNILLTKKDSLELIKDGKVTILEMENPIL